MKEKIKVKVLRPQLACAAGIAFSVVDGCFGHITRNLKMNIIYPEAMDEKSTKLYPCVVWLCGGGWLDVDSSVHIAYLSLLARQGFAVASPEYRTSNLAAHPAALKDAKAAIRYLKANAARYNIDSARIGVAGESAGGYLAAMAALSSSPDLEEGSYLEYSSSVRAACALYAPADFSKMPPRAAEDAATSGASLMLGKNIALHADEAMAISPVSFVTAGAPPFLIIHGNCDKTIPFAAGESLYERLIAAGCDARLIEVDGAGHADINFFQDEVWDAIAAFFSEKLKA